MSIQPSILNVQEQRSVLGICVLAAFADGNQDDLERDRIQGILNGFSHDQADLTSIYQDVLGGKFSLDQMVAGLANPSARALAYEMAVGICNADGALNDSERQFLGGLRRSLQLDATSTESHQQQAEVLVTQAIPSAVPPTINGPSDAELDRQILNAAILNGALEIMPHTIATMAIIPLQMRLVYSIGKQYGYELGRGHITEFLTTVGVGLTSQVFEGYARQLVGGLTRSIAGRFLGGLASQATGSAVSFATTYALGQVAKSYYASGRTLTTAQLKDTFASMLQDARSMQGNYSGQIQEQARRVNIADLLPLVKGA
jgi:uncharacterized protein (DUF697 family)/tellurite resistance protein